MHTEMPDPHPGRCKNFRTVWVSGYPETIRCLDYEGTAHVCHFPPPADRSLSNSHNVWVGGQPLPQPWIKPRTEPNDD